MEIALVYWNKLNVLWHLPKLFFVAAGIAFVVFCFVKKKPERYLVLSVAISLLLLGILFIWIVGQVFSSI